MSVADVVIEKADRGILLTTKAERDEAGTSYCHPIGVVLLTCTAKSEASDNSELRGLRPQHGLMRHR